MVLIMILFWAVLNRAVMILEDTGSQPMRALAGLLDIMTPSPLCPEYSSFVSPEQIHLVSQRPKISRPYLLISFLMLMRLPALNKVLTFQVPILVGLLV